MSELNPMSDKVLVLVDDEQIVSVRSASPLTSTLNQVLAKATEIDRQLLRRNFSKTLDDVQYILEGAAAKSEYFDIEDITVSLSIGKSGEVSLVSVAKGTATTGTCVTIRLRRRR